MTTESEEKEKENRDEPESTSYNVKRLMEIVETNISKQDDPMNKYDPAEIVQEAMKEQNQNLIEK